MELYGQIIGTFYEFLINTITITNSLFEYCSSYNVFATCYRRSIVGLFIVLADLSAVLYLILSPYNMNWCPTALNWNTLPALGIGEKKEWDKDY